MSVDVTMSSPDHDTVADEVPVTPPDALPFSQSQASLPSTEGPASPIEPDASLKTELNEHHSPSSQVIPSSLTPPPSSQVAQQNGPSAGQPLGYISSQRANMFSPPATTSNPLARRDQPPSNASEYLPPTANQISDASVEELRAMFHSCLAENARSKMETAHHKLQYSLLRMQAEEEANRAAVEHEMMRREVEVLRQAEHSRQARRELSAAAESTQAKYLHLKVLYEAAVDEIETLQKRSKLAKKVIQQKEDENISLTDERDMLLTRIRENREHFHMLCSPGGVFHGALTPKTPAIATPQQPRATPRHTPRATHPHHHAHSHSLSHIHTHHRDPRQENDTSQAGFAALLQALTREDNSAPSTPLGGTRLAPRAPPKHTRGAQSLSSLPTTPNARPRGDHSVLLPSADLVPHSEPPPRFPVDARVVPETPTSKRGRKSRESTISADDNEDIDRVALASVAAATQSFMTSASGGPTKRSQRHRDDEEEVYESQASQVASEMLRRDPRESFEVASSTGSRDGTPVPTEKSAKLQAKLYAGVNKPGVSEKRKFSGVPDADESRRDVFTSPPKKSRLAGGKIGLGIMNS
ncbi:hypothetical protein PG991_006805 [Apiospora marii]|uniref:FAD-dependent oxidoreductase-like enzyme n=2 Tax=Apiospora marii TaxID=335849 RepID=A0ABR1S0I8_9PEZI